MIHGSGIAGGLRIGDGRVGGRQGHVADGFQRDAVVPRIEPDERLPPHRWPVGPGVNVHGLVHGVLRRRFERVLNPIVRVDVIGACLRVESDGGWLSPVPVLARGARERQGTRCQQGLQERAAICAGVDH